MYIYINYIYIYIYIYYIYIYTYIYIYRCHLLEHVLHILGGLGQLMGTAH